MLLPLFLTHPVSLLKTGRGCFCRQPGGEHAPDCRELQSQLPALRQQRQAWDHAQKRQEQLSEQRQQLIQWHRTQGSFKGWHLGCQALRRLEAGELWRARQLADESLQLLPQSYEASVVKAWLSWPESSALEQALKAFERYEITLTPGEILPWYALLLKTLQDIREASLPDDQPFSMALLESLLVQEEKPESLEQVRLRQDDSPFEIQRQVAEAFVRFSQCHFYPPALIESLRAHLWDAFYGLGHETFIDTERAWRQRYWITGLIVFPLLFWSGQNALVGVWALLWIGRLLSYEYTLQRDLKRGRQRWAALMGPSPLPETGVRLN